MTKLTKAALNRKKPVTDEVLIPADDAQAKRLERAKDKLSTVEQALQLAEMGDSGTEDAQVRVRKAEEALAAVKADIRKTGTAFDLVGVGRIRWDELLREHPPTDDQRKEDEEKGGLPRTFNPKTFWPALLAETVAESDLTADDWRKEVFESSNWGPGELEELRNRASAVNQGSRILELGN